MYPPYFTDTRATVVGIHGNSRYRNAYLLDLGYQGFAFFAATVCDAIVYILGYQCIEKKIPTWKYVIIVLYMIIIYEPNIITHTILPLWVNRNSPRYVKLIGLPLNFIRPFGIIAYDVYFTGHFCYILFKVHVQKKMRLPRNSQIFIMKCMAHLVNW